MSRHLLVLLFGVLLSCPAIAAAVTEEDFLANDTQGLLNLCTAAPDDPRYGEAIHFCHGYLVGAYAYHVAEHSGPEGKGLVCLPNPPPSRNEAIAMFLEWVKAHPQYMAETPVETEFRFLTDKWPCKR